MPLMQIWAGHRLTSDDALTWLFVSLELGPRLGFLGSSWCSEKWSQNWTNFQTPWILQSAYGLQYHVEFLTMFEALYSLSSDLAFEILSKAGIRRQTNNSHLGLLAFVLRLPWKYGIVTGQFLPGLDFRLEFDLIGSRPVWCPNTWPPCPRSNHTWQAHFRLVWSQWLLNGWSSPLAMAMRGRWRDQIWHFRDHILENKKILNR